MNRDLAGREHWDTRELDVRRRLPSRLVVESDDLIRLLAPHIRPGSAVLEVGCAPGKFLLWCARAAGANVSGVEYAPKSAEATRRLFGDMHVPIDLRVEDFLQTTFPVKSFDLVYSFGVIEHFEDPRPMVRKHVELLKPGGKAIITIPNYRSPYGKLQAKLDYGNLILHNLHIMELETLRALAPTEIPAETRSYKWGRLTASLLSLDKRLPGFLARTLSLLINFLGIVQPVTISKIAPWLVLEITRR